MAFQFKNLDATTRQFMMQEVELDITTGTLNQSKNFNEIGISIYPPLIREAVRGQNEVWLAQNLQQRQAFKEYGTRTTAKGVSQVKVPVNAAEMFAEGEFNRFYMRGVCARVLAEGGSEVEAYRAKEVENPRSASQATIGQKFSAEAVLEDLRTSPGIDTALGLPPGPNSGLSVRF